MTKKNIFQNKSRDELIDKILELEEKLEKQKEENNKLKGQLKIDTQNSSKPSSTNIFDKKTPICNSRIKGENPRGGVKGHKGANLKREDKVDQIVDLTPCNCQKCALKEVLLGCKYKFNEKFIQNLDKITRQIIDLNDFKKFVTDYENSDVKCPKCGFLNVAIFPENIKRPIQLGENLKAFSVYLNSHGMLSLNRIQQLLEEIYGIKISQESLSNFNKKGFESLEEFEEKVTNSLINSELLHPKSTSCGAHSDESGIRVGGKLNRGHVVSSEYLTLYKIHEKRGKIAIREHNILPQFKGKLVTDHYALGTIVRKYSWGASYKDFDYIHYFCNAHHLRELLWVRDFEGKKWSEKLKKLLLKSKKMKETSIENNIFFLSKEVLDNISKEYLEILENGEKEYLKIFKKSGKKGRIKREKGQNLLLRLKNGINGTLGFIYDFNVPFTNNLAERDLRMFKLKNKVSGCFRSSKGSEYFARIRSYISTLRKQKLETFTGILSLFSGNILFPKM